MAIFRRARATCATCNRDLSRDVCDVRAKACKMRCPCGVELEVQLDRWWWVSYRFQGKVRRLRVAPDKRAAEKKEREVLCQVADGVDPAREKAGTMTLSVLFAAYWKSPAGARRRPGGVAKDKRICEVLLEGLGDKPAGALTAADLEAWNAKHADDLAPATRVRRLAVLSAVLAWAVRQDHIKARPRFPAIKVSNARTAWATKEQAGAILAGIADPVARDAVAFLFSTGCRRGELVGLTWPMVSLERGVVSLPADLCKNGKGRSIPINGTAEGILRRRLAQARPGCRVFHADGRPMSADGLSRVFRAAADKVDLGELVLHSCRHTCASWLVQAGTDLLTTAGLLGHSSLAMVQRYSHLSPAGLRAAVGNADFSLPAAPVRQAETEIRQLPQRAANSGES